LIEQGALRGGSEGTGVEGPAPAPSFRGETTTSPVRRGPVAGRRPAAVRARAARAAHRVVEPTCFSPNAGPAAVDGFRRAHDAAGPAARCRPRDRVVEAVHGRLEDTEPQVERADVGDGAAVLERRRLSTTGWPGSGIGARPSIAWASRT
jgi:hypothetical protein